MTKEEFIRYYLENSRFPIETMRRTYLQKKLGLYSSVCGCGQCWGFCNERIKPCSRPDQETERIAYEKNWLEKSGYTDDDIRAWFLSVYLRQKAEPCNCQDPLCQSWAMITQPETAEWRQLHAEPVL